MDHPIYDRELDAIPGIDGPHAQEVPAASRPGGTGPTPFAKQAPAGDRRSPFVEWFAARSLTELIGLSVSLGIFISAPLVLAMRPGARLIAVLVGVFLATPLL